MRKVVSVVFACGAMLALSGCAVVDGIAYGIKSLQGDGGGRSQAAPGAVAAPAPQPDMAPPPTPVRRDSVTVEQLPPPS